LSFLEIGFFKKQEDERMYVKALPVKTGRHRITAFLFLFLALLQHGCGYVNTPPLSPQDDPLHHYLQGMLALEEDDLETAGKKFDRALALRKEFAPALAGKALMAALRGVAQKDSAYRQVDERQAFALLKQADAAADGRAESFIVHVTAIRTLFVAKPADWIEDARDRHAKALAIKKLDPADLPYYGGYDAADYFMGVAMYRYDYRGAEPLFRKVLAAKDSGKWQQYADNHYAKIQKITRVSASRVLAGVTLETAVKDSVNRADVSALLAAELKLDHLFAGRIPVQSNLSAAKDHFTPADILESPFRSEIETLIKWKVRGLEPVYDQGTRAWLFKPSAPVTRKEFAMVIEDVLMKLIGDESISTALIGMEKSPFPDIEPQAAWFNAALTATSRGLMEAALSGEFRPEAPVDGADLLLAVFELRRILDI
jgi:hypothetical protein